MAFADKWTASWILAKELGADREITVDDGAFRTGRPRAVITYLRGGEEIARRQAMQLVSKAGRPYWVARRDEEYREPAPVGIE